MDIDELWAELRATNQERDPAQKRFEAARDALVSRICSCYRIDEKWEDSAMYCSQRMTKTCPYFLELRRHDS